MLERLKEKKAECLAQIAELKQELDKVCGKCELLQELIEEETAALETAEETEEETAEETENTFNGYTV